MRMHIPISGYCEAPGPTLTSLQDQHLFAMYTFVLRDDEHALVEIDLGSSIYRLTWREQAPSEVLRRILIQAHMQVLQHELRYWLSDSRALSVLRLEDEEWIKRTWTPRIFEAGLKRMALVPSSADPYRTPLTRMVEGARAELPFPVQFFERPEDGERWLLDQGAAVA